LFTDEIFLNILIKENTLCDEIFEAINKGDESEITRRLANTAPVYVVKKFLYTLSTSKNDSTDALLTALKRISDINPNFMQQDCWCFCESKYSKRRINASSHLLHICDMQFANGTDEQNFVKDLMGIEAVQRSIIHDHDYICQALHMFREETAQEIIQSLPAEFMRNYLFSNTENLENIDFLSFCSKSNTNIHDGIISEYLNSTIPTTSEKIKDYLESMLELSSDIYNSYKDLLSFIRKF
jgi:hypothetical protein